MDGWIDVARKMDGWMDESRWMNGGGVELSLSVSEQHQGVQTCLT